MQGDDEPFGARFEGIEAPFGFGQQAGSTLMCSDELVQRRRAVCQLGNRAFELGKDLLEGCVRGFGRAQVTLAAMRPRMPLTNLPASSPEKVLASSIDSLIAALVGTCLSMVIS